MSEGGQKSSRGGQNISSGAAAPSAPPLPAPMFLCYLFFYTKDEYKVKQKTIFNTGIYMHLRN